MCCYQILVMVLGSDLARGMWECYHLTSDFGFVSYILWLLHFPQPLTTGETPFSLDMTEKLTINKIQFFLVKNIFLDISL